MKKFIIVIILFFILFSTILVLFLLHTTIQIEQPYALPPKPIPSIQEPIKPIPSIEPVLMLIEPIPPILPPIELIPLQVELIPPTSLLIRVVPPSIKITPTPAEPISRLVLIPSIEPTLIEPTKDNLPLPKTYAEALAYAEAKNRKLLIVFKTKTCPYCDLLEETLKDKTVRASLVQQGICLIYPILKSREPQATQKYGVTSVPRYWIIDSKEKRYKTGLGYKGTEEFIQWIKY